MYSSKYELTVSFFVLNTGIATVVIRTGLWPSSNWVFHEKMISDGLQVKRNDKTRDTGKKKKKGKVNSEIYCYSNYQNLPHTFNGTMQNIWILLYCYFHRVSSFFNLHKIPLLSCEVDRISEAALVILSSSGTFKTSMAYFIHELYLP